MIGNTQGPGARLSQRRMPAAVKRPQTWLRELDKDLRLLVAIAFIVAGVLVAGLMTIREVERHLLKTAAIGAAVHWAEFLQSRLRGLDEILVAGLVADDDQRTFDFAGAAGGVRDYQVIRPDGIVALSNWSGDFRGATDAKILLSVLGRNSTVATVVDEEFSHGRSVIGQAYVPLISGAGKRGALKVDVDMTGQAEHYRQLGNGAFIALIALILPPGGLAGWLVARNMRAQRRFERLQRERGLVLEILAKGVDIDRVLLRVAYFAERHRPGSVCTILKLDSSGEHVAAAISPHRRNIPHQINGQRVDALAGHFAASLSAKAPSLHAVPGGGTAWSTPLYATSGCLLGSLILKFAKGVQVHLPDGDGPEMALAQLAALAVESRRAENVITEMRERNELILSAADDGIFGIDTDGRITFANPAAARMLGRNVKDMTGVAAAEVLQPPGGQGDQESPIAATLADGKARRLEKTEIRGHGGAVLPVQLVVTPIARRLSSLGAVVVIHDIRSQIEAQKSLRHAKEEAEDASRSKSNFLAHMSHELRTPLNAIIGFSEVMAGETLGPLKHPHYHEYAQHIHSSGQHLLSLINDLLDLSKIEAGKLELYEEAIDAHSLIKRCRVFVEESAHNKGVDLSIRGTPDLPLLDCDARKLKQVLVNLLSNAVKFTSEGGRVVLEADTDGAEGIVFRVSDTGIGIAPDDLDNVMEPFGQANEAMHRNNQGTGLGLPLAKALVELHGGSLELDSVLGKGTTATVHLPARAASRSSAGVQPRALAGGVGR